LVTIIKDIIDAQTLTLILGLGLTAVGSYMTFMSFSGRRFSSNWKPSGVSDKMDPEMAKRLIKSQSLIVLVVGIDLFILGLTGHDLLVETLAKLHL
jgi:hypothetical protein